MRDESPETRGPATASAPRFALGAAFAAGVLAGMAVTAAIFVFVLRPVTSPSLMPMEPATAVTTTPEPASVPEPRPAAPAPPPRSEPSRSRGRVEWLFFFKPGDQLVRMGDDTPMGMVVRVVPRHAFADGTVGPAYVLQLPDGGGQRIVDADELERGGRLQ